MSVVTVEAPDGIGEVRAGDDLAELILAVTQPVDGDIWVVTSKVVSKAEGRVIAEADKEAARRAESRRVVAKRGGTVIVEHRLGLVHAAAGIDSSNVAGGTALLLPVDPDASARAIRAAVRERTGATIGVVVSDTSGRAWRTGQIDLAIGLAGVLPLDSHVGRTDAYGNDLRVTEIAVADELASAADLAKTKLGGRPVAVIRGLGRLVTAEDGSSAPLLRDERADFFRLGRREAVLDAVLRATGQTGRWDELVELEGEDLVAAVVEGAPEDAGWIRRVL
ncbi:coenzyme F420-0:L-glutamate ligase [Mariniluteicoccus flavus]